jgi:hypothetical protein
MQPSFLISIFALSKTKAFMKHKILLSAIIVFCLFLTTKAQIKKGEKMLGGDLYFSNIHEKIENQSSTSKSRSFTISPQFGLGTGKNWILGITAGYSYGEIKNLTGSNLKSEVRGYSIGLFARKFHPFNEQFGIYGQVTADAGFGKATVSINNMWEEERVLSAYGQPGLYFIPGKKIILETTFGRLGFTNTKKENSSQSIETIKNEFNVSVVDGLGIGLKVII